MKKAVTRSVETWDSISFSEKMTRKKIIHTIERIYEYVFLFLTSSLYQIFLKIKNRSEATSLDAINHRCCQWRILVKMGTGFRDPRGV